MDIPKNQNRRDRSQWLNNSDKTTGHHRWLQRENQDYLNAANLTDYERRKYETLNYNWMETKVADVDAASFDPETDAYQAALEAEAELVYETNLALFKRAAARLTEHQRALLEQYLDGKSFQEIADATGTKRQCVSAAFYGTMIKGKHTGGIISAIKVEIERMLLADEIIALRDKGLSFRAIAKQLGTYHKLVRVYYGRYKVEK